MKASQAERLIRKHLLPDLREYKVAGKLLYRLPLEWILRGYHVDQGSAGDSIRVWVFFQPLYIPWASVHFAFGSTLGALSGGGTKWWQIKKGSEAEIMQEISTRIQSEGEEFLHRFASPAEILRNLREFNSDTDPLKLEMIAYTRVLRAGRSEGLEALDLLQAALRKYNPADPTFVRMRSRADALIRAVATERSLAIRLLKDWRAQTLDAIKLANVALPEDSLEVPAPQIP